jgi:quercetin dioxygenase-like cupin family protein
MDLTGGKMGFLHLNDVDERELIPGFHVRFIHSGNMTMAYWDIEAGAELPLHSHPHEQVANVLEGEIEFVLGEETRIGGPGTVVVIPGDVPHSGKAVTRCRILDVFHPVREDYR